MSKMIFGAEEAIQLARIVDSIPATPRYFSENQELIDAFVNRMETLDRFQKAAKSIRFGMSIGMKSTGVEITEETLVAIAALLEFHEENRL